MPSYEAEYERVFNGVSRKIAARLEGYRPGDRLPTIDGLAAEYDVSGTTVKTALVLLRQGGWTIGRQGKGTFVAENPPVEPV